MIAAHEDIELAIRLPADQAEREEVLRRLAAQQIEVASCSSYWDHDRVVLLLIANDPVRAAAVLTEAGYSCKSKAVVLLDVAPNHPDQLAEIGRCLDQAGVAILSSHVAPRKEGNLCAVMHTTNNQQALDIITHAV